MPWFAVPVQWTLNETILVKAATAELAAASVPLPGGCDVARCDNQECEVLTDLIEQLSDEAAVAAQRPDRDDYLVSWSIDVAADSPRAAALRALEIQRNPDSIATYFDVTAPDGTVHAIDFLADEQPEG